MFPSTSDYRGGDFFNRKKKSLKEFVENYLEVDNQCTEWKESEYRKNLIETTDLFFLAEFKGFGREPLGWYPGASHASHMSLPNSMSSNLMMAS